MASIRTYTELSQLPTFEDRFRYLALHGVVGEPTFGSERYLNQKFYNSSGWRRIRNHVIVRDSGGDLGMDDRLLYGRIYIHHMNPMRPDDVRLFQPEILDPEFLISVSFNTHNAIHYGDENLLPRPLVERRPGDTNLW